MAENEIFGIMRHHPEKKEVPITPRNSLFFPEFQADGTPIMVYQGTGLVASMLESMNDCRKITGKDTSCSFFDVEGNFHDNAVLRDLRVIVNGSTKHTAYFESNEQEMAIPADDIYCLGAAVVAEEIAFEQMQKAATGPIPLSA
jgi:hypothetical protein